MAKYPALVYCRGITGIMPQVWHRDCSSMVKEDNFAIRQIPLKPGEEELTIAELTERYPIKVRQTEEA